MINGGKKVIWESLDMKSILKNLLKNKLVILSVIDVAIIFWIAWYESQREYEPLLEIQYEVLSEMGLPLIPLCDIIYNTIIVGIVINTMVLLFELRRICKGMLDRYDMRITYMYLSLMMFSMLWGSSYISARIYGGVISESNSLFWFPIWAFGKELFTSVITATRLYMLVCFMHLSVCLFYLYIMCVAQQNHGDESPGNT